MRIALIVIAVILITGCGSRQPAAVQPSNNSATNNFEARLTAGLAISDVSQKGSALAKVAEDAAAAGDAKVVTKALAGIYDVALKNGSAASAALKLADAGKLTEATEVAKSITDVALKNKTLASIAKG